MFGEVGDITKLDEGFGQDGGVGVDTVINLVLTSDPPQEFITFNFNNLVPTVLKSILVVIPVLINTSSTYHSYVSIGAVVSPDDPDASIYMYSLVVGEAGVLIKLAVGFGHVAGSFIVMYFVFVSEFPQVFITFNLSDLVPTVLNIKLAVSPVVTKISSTYHS